MRHISALLFASVLAVVVSADGGPAKWPRTWTTPPRGTPSDAYPGGPVLGNGNIGVSIGGAPGLVQLYFSTHGFYSVAPWAPVGPLPATVAAAEGGAAVLPAPGFPGCPSPNCTIPVGLVLGNLEFSSPELAGSWAAVQALDNATTAVTLRSIDGKSSLELTVFVPATMQGVIVTVTNAGSTDFDLNVTVSANSNVLHVPISIGCGNPATPAPCMPGPGPFPGLWVVKAANFPNATFPVTGVLGVEPLGWGRAPGVTTTALASYLVPQHDWKSNTAVETQTMQVTTLFTLPAAADFALAASIAASQDPDVVPQVRVRGEDDADCRQLLHRAACCSIHTVPQSPVAVVASRLTALNASSVPALYAAHTAWWADFWAASDVSLDPRYVPSVWARRHALRNSTFWASLSLLVLPPCAPLLLPARRTPRRSGTRHSTPWAQARGRATSRWTCGPRGARRTTGARGEGGAVARTHSPAPLPTGMLPACTPIRPSQRLALQPDDGLQRAGALQRRLRG